MTFLSEFLNAMYGCYRLARLDPAGMSYFNVSEEGFWNSFKAAAVVFPLYCLLLLVHYTVDEVDVSFWRFLSVELIAYVIIWVAFPVVMIGLCRQFDRLQKYAGFIIAFNWASVPQNALYIPISILSITGQLTGAGGMIVLIAIALILTYTWFIAKTALDVPAPVAVGIVIVEMVINLGVNLYAKGLL